MSQDNKVNNSVNTTWVTFLTFPSTNFCEINDPTLTESSCC